ncbi:MAG: hypothetical protein IJV21_01955 [Lachnospiraceae bacterium]|nr:hypothetical protein [Lachnospiraceae bacterium]
MKQTAKIITAALFVSAVLFAGAENVYAEGLNVSVDKENCDIGDTVTVTVDATGLEGTAPADIQVEFDGNRLNFVNCSVQYGGGGGGLVTFKESNATVEFTTLSGGNAEVKVTATAEDAAEPETASVSIAVAGEDTAAALGEGAQSDLGVSPGRIDIQDGRVIQTVFADEFKPILFHKEVTDYNGQQVECAKFDMGDMTLLYTTDASGADGKFMIYDQATGNFDDFRMIQGIENRFIIVLADCEGEIPAGYTKAVLDWNGQTLTAFMEEDVAAGTSAAVNGIDPADFFLVYAVSSEGHKGWYRYDKNEGTYQRYIIATSAEGSEGEGVAAPEETEEAGLLDDYIPGNIQSLLLIIFAALALILIITVIILAVRLHEYAEDLDARYEGGYYEDDEEDDDEEDEDDEEEVLHRTRRAGAVTAASLVGRSMSDDDEEDEDDDDEEDDEDDEEDDNEEDEDEADEEDEDDSEEDVGSDEEEDDDEEEDEEYEDDEEDEDIYERPLTRKERKELERERKEREREEKWRLKEEKKAAKRRAKGYEEATPMDWSSFEKERDQEGGNARKSQQSAKLPPRKKVVRDEEIQEA